MLTEAHITANKRFFSKLFTARGWQWDEAELVSRLQKPRLRSFYLPVRVQDNEYFFKSAVLGGQPLRRKLKKEALVTGWVSRRLGIAPALIDQASGGLLFWFLREYDSALRGFVCVDEKVDQLTSQHVRLVAQNLLAMRGVAYAELPSWKSRLVVCPENWSRPEVYFRQVLLFIKILRPAQKEKTLHWDKETERRVMGILSKLKIQLGKNNPVNGCLVHGDVAPNNVYFSPNKVRFLDWEWSFWAVNRQIGWGLDVANFYTRLWQRPKLAEEFLGHVSGLGQPRPDDAQLNLATGIMFSVLQKIAPMFQEGIWRSEHDRNHFNWLVKELMTFTAEVDK